MANNQTVGVIGPSFAGDFMVAVTTGIHEAASRRGFDVFAVEGSPKVVSEHQLGQRHIAGWIVLLDTTDLEVLAPDPTPAVIISCPAPNPRYPVVKPDNRDSARALVQHLVDHGHRQIAFVGNLNNDDMRERSEIYQDVLRDNGLTPDPRYLLDVGDYTPERTENTVRAFFALQLPCTAIVAANDGHALATMDVIHSQGRRIPEDVAVAGFDDINAAQYADPPLTTVRQQSDALGRMAAEILFDLLDGRQPAQAISYVPTVPILRRSCGCQTLQENLAGVVIEAGVDWRTTFKDRVLRALRFPLPVDPNDPVERIWPGIETIIGGLDAAVAGGQLPSIGALEQSWHDVVEIQGKPDIILAVDQAVEEAAAACLAAAPDRAAPIGQLLQSSQLAMFRACLSVQRQEVTLFSRLLWANHELGLVLVSAQARRGTKLAWLDRLPVQVACLAVWADGAKGSRILEIETVFSRDDSLALAPGQRYAAADFPPPAFFDAARAGGDGATVVLVPIRSPSREWGVLIFGNPFVARAIIDINSTHMWSMILSGAFEREALEATLEKERATLRGAYDRERALADTVRELGCPIIPLLPGVLLVPLIGVIDSRRAQQIVETVLYGVGAQQAEHVLLDITGVPMVDTQVAGSLLQIASATMLLGARVALVGVRPEIAQSIVGLGIDLRTIVTYPTLAAAVQSLQRLG